MADLFALKNLIARHESEKPRIDILRSILHEDEKGKNSLSILFPSGATEVLINDLRSYGFKAHNIDVKDPKIKNAKACLIQW